jgi:chaperonin cofactor prefoldin
MSFLSENQQEELASFLEGKDLGEQSNGIPAFTQQTVDNEPKQTEAVKSSPSASEDEGHSVPYNRFKSVITARNELRERTDYLESQLKSLEEQLSSAKSFQSSRSAFDEIYSGFTNPSEPVYEDETSSKLRRFEQVAEQFEVFQAKQQLEQELAVANSKYPDVPRDVLLTAVVQNPQTDIMDIAERYNTFVSAIKEDAIAQYTRANGGIRPAPEAPPRVGSASVARTNMGFGDSKQVTNLSQAKESLVDYLRQNGWR